MRKIMDRDQFLTRVAHYATPPSHQQAERATHAVLNTLTERLSGAQAGRLTAYLPPQIAARLTGAGRHVGALSRDSFLTQIGIEEDVHTDTAELHARAVLETLRESLPDNDTEQAMAALPRELTVLLT